MEIEITAVPTAYVYSSTGRVGQYATRAGAMRAAERLAGSGAQFSTDRCHGVVGAYTGDRGTFTVTE